MSRRQRLAFLGIAVAIAIAAVIILSAGGGSDTTPGASATATPNGQPQEASPGQAATATPTPAPLLTAGHEQTITVAKGATVRLRIRVAKDDIVHVHGYNIEKPVPAGRTLELSFPATIDGIFEIELHQAGVTIGRLKVEPK
jgi:FtsP/CotA-like multicopper oxidase with cupredoxin domain